MTANELRARGRDPDDRTHYTGHKAQLAVQWIPSIGYWARLDTREMINSKDINAGLVRVKGGAFRQFAHDRGLMTRAKFEALHRQSPIEKPWLLAELSFRAYHSIQTQMRYLNGGVSATLGEVCAQIALEGLSSTAPKSLRLGLLPIELVCWTRAFELLRWHLGITLEQWDEFDDDTKHAAWNEGISGEELTMEQAVLLPAVRHLKDPRTDRVAVAG